MFGTDQCADSVEMLVALHYRIAAVLCVFAGVYGQAQWVSPCPELFQYEPQDPNEPDRWYGSVTLVSEFELFGVWLSLIFDKPPIQLGNWFGEVAVKEDKREYLIMNPGHIVPVNTPYKIRFYVRYNPKLEPPKLQGFRFNAKTVCPATTVTPPPDVINGGQSFTSVERTTVPSQTTVPSEATAPSTDQVSGQLALASGILETPSLVHAPSLPQIPSPSVVDSEQGSTLESVAPSVPGQMVVPDPSSSPSVNDIGQSTTLNPVTQPATVFSPEPDSSSAPSIGSRGQSIPSSSVTEVTPSAPVSISSEIDETDDDDFLNEGFIQEPHTLKPSVNIRNDFLICGVVVPNPRPLITNGQATRQAEFPWHGGLYVAKGYGLEYICGATLITRSHVITVAHCVTLRNTTRTISPDGLVVYLGKFYLKKWSSPGIQDKNVRQITIHRQFNPRNFDNDIGIVRLVSEVEITNYVRPVCLWGEDTQLKAIVGKVGTVTGWGFDENGKIADELIKSKMPVVSQEACIYSYPDFFARFTTARTFCAGFRNGTSVCNGDSGGGMVFPRAKTIQGRTVWQLRGLVSISLSQQNKNICETSQYVVFTDVAQHLDWIRTLLY